MQGPVQNAHLVALFDVELVAEGDVAVECDRRDSAW